MPCGWEGNRRSGVALPMRYRLQWLIHLRAHDLRKGDEHPAYTRHGIWHSCTFHRTVYGAWSIHVTGGCQSVQSIGSSDTEACLLLSSGAGSRYRSTAVGAAYWLSVDICRRTSCGCG